ncbi:MAG: nuclear transport factor 2 family protein [Cyclobacteriaceae bacterium]|nr:nuclear transport factor 2 family protein [Cyclobacteriaceae bacterium]MCK5210627.1 nuclear transport factor 2 family protein [Cyclobacteriaceae bacterium]MCK5280457.1 nuclear transport factor 2 family protein [Cyclobacteriaceae bacterium]MCK5371789.1 nuclear transport factor 2 family protein [Cyclobacteriaceae bacterium]
MDDSLNVTALENVAIVKQFFKYYKKNDIVGLREIFAPDIEWHVPGHHPLAGTKKGVEEVIAYYKQLQKANFKAEVIILEGNDNHVIDCHRGWAQVGGQKLDMSWVLLYTIENGKITSMQNFPSDQHAADAFFWKVYKLKDIPDRLNNR